MSPLPLGEKHLHALQHDTFAYFLCEANPENGLIADSTRADSPASIAAVGLALACYPVGVERGFLKRADAIERTIKTLRFFGESKQSTARDATGYKGFYYHFLDMKSGRRAWKSELSSVDTALLLAGVLTVAQYFDFDTQKEREIRERAAELYARTDWRWMQNLDAAAPGQEAVTHGWRPGRGFLKARWQGYNEGIILYALGLAAPDHPLTVESYASWCSTYKWKKIYDTEYLYAGPLFTHQMAHSWIDFRGIQDEYMRAKGIDYFENSRRATLIQREYARRNPRQFDGYDEWCWGITAGEGPGDETKTINGRDIRFYSYRARGVPFGPDDGTLAPWGVLSSLPFTPEIVLPTIASLDKKYPEMTNRFGFKCSFNPTYAHSHAAATTSDDAGWVSQHHLGIDQGPVVLMIENHRSGLIWQLMRDCRYLADGLRKAGFEGGWLGKMTMC